jgi:cell division septation protein DedD
MLDDLLRSPEKYEPGVAELLQELVSGHKSLSSLADSEMAVLDRATLDFNRSSSKKPSETSTPSSPKKKPAPSSEDGELEERIPEDLAVAADEAVPQWLR